MFSRTFFRLSNFLVTALLIAYSVPARSQELLVDSNADGVISILNFGDSITYGIGDNISVGQSVDTVDLEVPPNGYPRRLNTYFNIPVSNSGDSGEQITENGFRRYVGVARSTTADVISILEGSNDAGKRIDTGEFLRAMQRMINVTSAFNKTLIIATLPIPCCNHGAQTPFTRSFSNEVRKLAAVNELQLVDVERAWITSCSNPGNCESVPEGLHPNTPGYDIIAQTFAATLLGVDVFAEGGAAELESALGLAPGTVLVQPDLRVQ